MTSVVDTSVKHFHSGMSGAPVLNGQAGSLISLLDACLVFGFDTKAVTTLQVTSGVATLSFSGSHSATVDSVVLVTGASVAALNGEQKVTTTGVGTIKFATAAADGIATGTVTFKMASAGWQRPFVGINLSTYKSADPAGTGMTLRVDDTDAKSARVVGYEQMTDVSTGTGLFPTPAKIAGGGYWSKSAVANTAYAPWVLVSDGRKFILHINSYSPQDRRYQQGVTRGFGDDIPFSLTGDPYACSLNYSSETTQSSQTDDGLDNLSSISRNALVRDSGGIGTAVMAFCYPYSSRSINVVSGADPTFGSFPDTVEGSLRLGKKYFAGGGGVRAELPGLYYVAQAGLYSFYKTLDILVGEGALAGRRLIALNPALGGYSPPDTSNTGVSFIDITGPWR